jgi:hypothetical protein
MLVSKNSFVGLLVRDFVRGVFTVAASSLSVADYMSSKL